MADGTAGGGARLILAFDLDKLAIGAGVTGLSSPLQKLLSQAPQGTQAALAWLPDLELSEAQTLLSLQTGAIGAYVVVADADGNPLASTFVFITEDAGQPQAAVGLALDAPVDLAATPLFGTFLSGVRITGLGVSYATQDFPAGAIELPGGAPSPYPEVPSGFGLTVTVDANGSQQTFRLPPPDTAASATSALSGAPARPGSAADAAGPAVTWFDVQKSIGPLSIDRVGLAAAGGTLGLAIDASLDTDVVSIQLTGFTVAFTPNAMTSAPPSVSLDGLAVSVDADPVQIAGALVRSQGQYGAEYDGALLIRAGSYAIDAAGSYATVAGAPSLFVFGVAEGPFGGPPAFFVTGLAAGFGVNRALRLPTIVQLGTYPLIVAAGSSVVPPGAPGTQDALAQLNSGGWVPPAPGEYWVAAGVQFNSFELINGVLLATVEFGKDLVIALLGLASLRFPTLADAGDEGPVYAYVEVALEAVLRPQDGVLSIEALLTPNSFVLDPSCHLTGGLAFYSWFGGNPHAGDFVFAVGGYNPVFPVPAWYPAVPRLGFSWQLDDTLAISGEAYFAVTPTAIMAGGRLSATFAAGGLRAWFIAQADFLVSWRPFWYDIEVSVSIGVSYTATIAFVSGTFTVELGVSVHLWGPPLEGIAHVEWWVISFDVPINIPQGGSDSPSPQAATLKDWPTFARTSLPQDGSPCRARAAGGLQSIVTTTTAAGTAGETIWLFSGDTLALATETVIPASQVLIDGTTMLAGPPVSVYPLAAGTTVAVAHEVRVAAWAGATWQPGNPLPAAIGVSGWGWAAVTGNLPAALWGTRSGQAQEPAPDSAATVAAVTGVTGTGQATPGSGLTVQLTDVLISPLAARGLALGAGPAGTPGPATTGDTRAQVAATIDDPAVTALRGQVLSVAASSGLRAALPGGTLPLLASEIHAVLTSEPMLGRPGTTGPPGTAVTSGVTSAGTAAAEPAPPAGEPAAGPGPGTAAGPALRALFRRAARTHAAVADRWSTGAEALALSAAAPAAGVIPPGATAVWDLPGENARTVPCEADATLWVVTLDDAQRPAQALVPPRADGGVPVPAGATRVAVTALAGGGNAGGGERPAGGRSAGWQGAGELRQIASQALLGESAVIRPQSPAWLPRRRSSRSRRGGRGHRELGVTTGRAMVERTWTQGAGGRVERGWIETYLPAWCRAVVVGLVPEDGQGGPGGLPAPLVTVRRWSDGTSPPPAAEPAAATLGGTARGGGAYWVLTVPGDTAGAATAPADGGQLAVRATAPDGWRLDGVLGLEAAPGPVTGWSSVTGAWRE